MIACDYNRNASCLLRGNKGPSSNSAESRAHRAFGGAFVSSSDRRRRSNTVRFRRRRLCSWRRSQSVDRHDQTCMAVAESSSHLASLPWLEVLPGSQGRSALIRPRKRTRYHATRNNDSSYAAMMSMTATASNHTNGRRREDRASYDGNDMLSAKLNLARSAPRVVIARPAWQFHRRVHPPASTTADNCF